MPPACDRCAHRQARRREAQIAWPITALCAWLVVAFLALGPVGTSSAIAIGYGLGAGLVGAIDLFIVLKRGRRGGCALLFVFIVLSPVAIAAGCVMAPVRGAMATVSFVRGRQMARRLEELQAGVA
ncbi:MAG: hypothetical protein ACREQM_19960 [Candidatus Dormibacteraceae bacterium]